MDKRESHRRRNARARRNEWRRTMLRCAEVYRKFRAGKLTEAEALTETKMDYMGQVATYAELAERYELNAMRRLMKRGDRPW